MTQLRTLSPDLWELDQYLNNECGYLLYSLKRISPKWDHVYSFAYKSDGVCETIQGDDNTEVKMAPYRLWQIRYGKEKNLDKAIYMLCSMGILGVVEDDIVDKNKKEWIFYSILDDFETSRFYCDILNSGAKRASGVKLVDWIQDKLQNGNTNYKMVRGDGWSDIVTTGVPTKLGRALFGRERER